MQNQKYKSQHWIPRKYLRRWTLPPEHQRVRVFAADGTPLGTQFARGLFQTDDLYTKTKPDGSRDVGLERGLQHLETKFGAVVPKIERRETLDDHDAGWLIAFVCASHARTPAQGLHDRHQWANVLRVGRDLEQSIAKLSPDQAERHRRSQPRKINAAEPSLTLEQVQRIVDAPLQTLLLPRLVATMKKVGQLNPNVAILCAPPEHPFVTSDAPSIWYNRAVKSERDLFYSQGMDSLTFEINMPLSPTRALVLSQYRDAYGYMDLSAERACEFNRRIVLGCDERFIALQSSADPRWFDGPAN